MISKCLTPLILVTAFLSIGAAGELNAEVPDLVTAMERLGVCGPIHEAVLDFSPMTAEGEFDLKALYAERTSTGGWRLDLPVPDRVNPFGARYQPTGLHLSDFRGALQLATFAWQSQAGEPPKIFKPIARQIRSSLGRPEIREPDMKIWTREPYSIMLIEPDDSDITFLIFSCLATEREYNAALEAAEAAQHVATEASNPDESPPNPWLDRSVIDVLWSFGPPVEAPLTPADNVVGLHYTRAMGEDEVPTEWWWWFVDGKAIYAAGDFLPPRGSKRARSSYVRFRETIRGIFGEPAEDGRDPETGDERMVFEAGRQLFTLQYLDPEGDPWFRIECFDDSRLNELPDELRPNRKLPKRFIRPRQDSGLTRDDLIGQSGAG